mgnify:CR=1 FL=1
MAWTAKGSGDEATWPAYSGHPGDPRAPAEPELKPASAAHIAAATAQALDAADAETVYEWICSDAPAGDALDEVIARDIARPDSALRAAVLTYLVGRPEVDKILAEQGLYR